uniref:Secreted protein n=1 Tax=Globodera rostochiensis TaxID=31243 RepID=A0A914I0Z6_GLORO
MKFLNYFIVFFLLLSIFCIDNSFVVGALPPQYLDIEGHEKCFHVQPSVTSDQLCLPAEKKEECSDNAWKALNELEDSQHPPTCARTEQQQQLES